MRSSISVQSCASVPPAPAESVAIALPASYSPVNSASSAQPLELRQRARTAAPDASSEQAVVLANSSSSAGRSPISDARPRRSRACASARACSRRELRGAPWSSQNRRVGERRRSARRDAVRRRRVKGSHGPRQAGPAAPGSPLRARRACSGPSSRSRPERRGSACTSCPSRTGTGRCGPARPRRGAGRRRLRASSRRGRACVKRGGRRARRRPAAAVEPRASSSAERSPCS